ncbi:MAG: MFS transporter [Promethearchaeota archaeon]
MSKEHEFDAAGWERVPVKKLIHYSFGYLLVFFMGGFFNMWVFYYYEVEVGLPVALLGLAFVIFAIWNMINDPLLGYLTDRPFKWSMKYGFRAPWMIIGAIPYIICWWLLFAIPNSLVESSDPWPIFWYFIIVACAFDTFYSLFSIHINAGFTTYFRTDADRRRSSAINTTVPMILQLLMGFTVPIIYIYGDRNSMILAQSVVVLLLILVVLLFIPGIRETEGIKEAFLRGYQEKERVSYYKTMKAAFKRRNFLVNTIIFMIITLAGTLVAASGAYFMKDVLGLPLYPNMIYTAIAGMAGYLLFIPFWTNFMKKYGAAKTMKLSFILATIGYSFYLWISTIEQAIIMGFIGGFFAGSFYIPLGPVQADVYDECTIAQGKHQEAAYEGIRTFFYRIAIIGQAVIFVVIHVTTGYNPDPKATQTPLAVWGIRIHAGLIPALLAFLCFILMHKYYDLIGEKQKALKTRLREMRL